MYNSPNGSPVPVATSEVVVEVAVVCVVVLCRVVSGPTHSALLFVLAE